MSRLSRRKMLTTLAVAPVAIGAVARTAGSDSDNKKVFKTLESPREKLQRRYFPNFELTTHDRRKVHFYDDLIKDKIVVINFMYVKCEGICMPITMNLKKVQRLLGDRVGRDIFMYSITLKPAEDSVEDLRQFAALHDVGDGWLFLTGTPPDVDRLRRALGFSYPDPVEDADLTNHVGMVRFGVEPLTRWGACPGMARPEHIARSILWDLQ